MPTPIFADKTNPPEETAIANVLGTANSVWSQLREQISKTFSLVTEEWAWSGKNYGWSLRLKQKARAILYMKPCEGFILVSFALGEQAIHEAKHSKLPSATMKIIESAPKYPEGRAVRLEIENEKDIATILKIAEIKMAN